MKKLVALAAGLTLALSGGTLAVAQADGPTSQAGNSPSSPRYLVMTDRAAAGAVAAKADSLQHITDASDTKLAIVTTTVAGMDAMSDDLPTFGKEFSDGTATGSYVAFTSLDEATTYATRPALSLQMAPSYTIDQSQVVTPMLPQVSGDNIFATIKYLSTTWPNRYTTTRNARKAADWLKSQYEQLSSGKDYASTEFYTGCSNCGGAPLIMHTIKGTDLPNEYVIMGGHYDSTLGKVLGENDKAPGADDNASSQGNILETLRVLHANNWRGKRTAVFFSYPAEETGRNGSIAAAEWFKSQNKNVIASFNLDMTAWEPSNAEHDYTVVTDNSSSQLIAHYKNLIRKYTPDKTRIREWACGYQCSDHASWTSEGYPAAMLSEPVLNRALHTPRDNIDTLGNSGKVAVRFSQIGLAYIVETAKTGSSVGPKPTKPPTTKPPADDGLANGTAIDASVKAGQQREFFVNIPANAKDLKIDLNGSNGDADLYVKYGEKATYDAWDCRPFLSGSNETCNIASPQEGKYSIMVDGATAATGLKLVATWSSNE